MLAHIKYEINLRVSLHIKKKKLLHTWAKPNSVSHNTHDPSPKVLNAMGLRPSQGREGTHSDSGRVLSHTCVCVLNPFR